MSLFKKARKLQNKLRGFLQHASHRTFESPVKSHEMQDMPGKSLQHLPPKPSAPLIDTREMKEEPHNPLDHAPLKPAASFFKSHETEEAPHDPLQHAPPKPAEPATPTCMEAIEPAVPTQPVSINRVLRENCRQKLWVEPLAWIDQPRLLGFYFQKHHSERPPSRSQKWRADEDVVSLLRLCGFKPHSHYETLLFTTTNLAVPLVANILFRPTKSRTPRMIHVKHSWISESRIRRHGPRTDDPSSPVNRKKEIKLRKMTPVDITQDPYVVALLIAVAQKQRDGKAREKSHYDVGLVITHHPLEETGCSMHVYHARIPVGVLQRLEKPGREFAVEEGVAVDVYPVEFGGDGKVVGLERIQEALGWDGGGRCWY
ncbi:hypothetical protein OQA88_5351 [Cercophora sp. LCS_1]